MPIRVQTPAGIAEFPDGTDPAVMERALREQFPSPAASHEPPKRNLIQEQTALLEQDGSGLIGAPVAVAGQVPGIIGRTIKKFAPNVMRNAMGAQESIRSKFPTVDLDAVALREGAVPGSASSIAEISRKAKSAGRGVNTTASTLDATPNAPRVTRSQLIEGLRPIHRSAVQAHSPEASQAVVDRMRQIAKDVPREGLTLTESQARKQLVAQQGKAARSAPTPKEAGIGPQMFDAERRAIASAQHGAGMGPALEASQELMALERAMGKTGRRTSLLRDAIASGGGSTAGAVLGALGGGPVGAIIGAPVGALATTVTNRALTSPTNLGKLANRLHRQPEPNASTRQAVRQMLLQLLNQRSEEQ